MSPRQRRWTLVGALVCLSGIAAQRARGEEASPNPPGVPIRTDLGTASARQPVPTPRDDTSVVGPLRLVRPLSPDTLARVLAEAEQLYRSAQLEQARQAYATLVELDPLNAHAWLRLGNLHQRAGRDAESLEAYRSASLTVPATRIEAESRGKALLNIALLHVASASRAIDELDAMGLAALGDARADIARQVGAQRHRAHRAAARDFEAPGMPRDAAVATQPEAGGPTAADRRGARSRPPSARRDASGRGGTVASAIEASPAAGMAVEVLHGSRGVARP